ncbi:hypothetical protein [Kitasatospora cinereorecta]|uniref:Lipoprotein n=1 Tax=Kitasatospora cinereorecta TaxID=285560 RepID=A0ABW0V6S4_9ACTN
MRVRRTESSERAPVGRRWLPPVLATGFAAVVAVAGCSSSSSNSSSTPTSTFSPNPSNFSGSPPSAFASIKSSALASVSAAASSVSAAASSFAASAGAQLEQNRAEATSVLGSVSGSGNALSDVTVTGLPKSQSGGLNAAVVTIVNSTSSTANYAVKVEFLDTSGQVVDSSVLAVKNLAAGGKAQPIAFTLKSPDAALIPRVAQAQRY